MRLQESGEMYLETIHILQEKNGSVRSVDISEHMGYSKPSVSRAVGLLKSGGYITVSKEGLITLTETGTQRAQKIYARHTLLTKVLTMLGVSKETADEDACKIEHAISDETFQALQNYVNRKFD